ncbi:hypothetical protein TRVA0_027S01222 [Trichomonascus vanleenenianus]|uniref:uncharacterized protein n=1 Tax=Trichomonascus vanleenenianus TaxID=2268995 RepID=UPI003ECB983A
MIVKRSTFPSFPVLRDLHLYPYDPVTKPDDIEKLLKLSCRAGNNPLVPLPDRPPIDRHGKVVTIELRQEVLEPFSSSPRVYEALIKRASRGFNLRRNLKVIVEIYDPRSFGYNSRRRSENTFLHTIACYRKLEQLQGKTIPKYYGTFTMVVNEFHRHEERNYSLSVVLREYIDGIFMDNLEVDLYTQEERQAIMKKVIDAEREVDDCGVSVGPKSFILVEQEEAFKVIVWLFPFTALDPSSDHLYISPGIRPSAFLKWKEKFLNESGFRKFVDWPWVTWLYDNYKHEIDSIKDAQKALVGGLDEEVMRLRQQDERATVEEQKKRQNEEGVEEKKLNGRLEKRIRRE